jgi:hypothetical protein
MQSKIEGPWAPAKCNFAPGDPTINAVSRNRKQRRAGGVMLARGVKEDADRNIVDS